MNITIDIAAEMGICEKKSRCVLDLVFARINLAGRSLQFPGYQGTLSHIYSLVSAVSTNPPIN